jgi:DNA-binding beta-propeller fold protein YncE
MILRRVVGLAVVALAFLICMSCGEVYRPVVIPINPTPPNPANFHAVFGLNANAPYTPGTALQIDVSGDTNIGEAYIGVNPTHAGLLPGNNRVFVASAGSIFPGDTDVVTSFTPAAGSSSASGLGTPIVFTLPNLGPGQVSAITSISEAGNIVTVTLANPLIQAQAGGALVISSVVATGSNPSGYDGNFTILSVNGSTIQYVDSVTGLPASSGGTASIPVPVFCQYLPDYVTTTQSSTVYVANYGVESLGSCNVASTDSVVSLSAATNTISNIKYLNPTNTNPAPHPVAMVETPNQQNLYVVNQGNNTVVDLSPIDLSTVATISVGNVPVWAAARLDNQRVYVLTQGDGNLVPIDVASNTILHSDTNLSVGAGANFLLYDSHLNRIYVTNPVTGNVFVFSTTGGTLSGVANDTPTLLATIPMNTGTTPPCPITCSPVSVTALADGSRFYVASYGTQNPCADATVGPVSCVVPMLTVFNALSMTVKPATSSVVAPSMSLLSAAHFATGQYAVPAVASCAPAATYAPGTTRFRMFTTAAADSSHVYVSICDAGAIADITAVTSTIATGGSNSPDTLITTLTAPFANCSGATCSSVATISAVSIQSGVATFTAANNFTPGTKVTISGLTSAAAVPLNGQTLTVLATGLLPTTFEALVPTTVADGSGSDTGTAVPLLPPQAPIFLLTGQ